MPPYKPENKGFTLIELSIVLVIIGLLVGAVLVGKDLISASEVRAQIAQIEKYNTAVKTFRLKYGYLPGDIPSQPAADFGFAARGLYQGQGDNSGFIEGVWNNAPGTAGPYQQRGETCLFWVDLSSAQLIDGNFTTCTAISTSLTDATIDAYFPKAKMERANVITVYGMILFGTRNNWFFLSAGIPGTPSSKAGLTTIEAYQIDKKIDDSLPQSGKITNLYYQPTNIYWSATGYNNINLAATPGSATTCMDNNNTGGAVMQYSTAQNNGTNITCGLSLQFQ